MELHGQEPSPTSPTSPVKADLQDHTPSTARRCGGLDDSADITNDVPQIRRRRVYAVELSVELSVHIRQVVWTLSGQIRSQTWWQQQCSGLYAVERMTMPPGCLETFLGAPSLVCAYQVTIHCEHLLCQG